MWKERKSAPEVSCREMDGNESRTNLDKSKKLGLIKPEPVLQVCLLRLVVEVKNNGLELLQRETGWEGKKEVSSLTRRAEGWKTKGRVEKEDSQLEVAATCREVREPEQEPC